MPAAVVLADAPAAPDAMAGLAELSTAARARLQAALVAHAARWAAAVAPGAAVVAVAPSSAAGAVAELVGPAVRVEPQGGGHPGERAAAAVARAYARDGGPGLLASALAPRLAVAHAEAALGDLAGGAVASFGPAMDGGWYLTALAEPRPELFELAAEVWQGPIVMARTLEIARQLELEVGLLRMERRLLGPGDLAAVRADPLTPPEVRAALSA